MTIFRFLPLICKLIGVTKLGLHHSIVQTFAIPMTYTVLSKSFKTLTNFMHETDIFSHEEMSRHPYLIFLNVQEPDPGRLISHVTKPALWQAIRTNLIFAIIFIKENEVDTCRLYDFNEYLKGKKEQSYLQPFDLSLQL